MQLSAGLVLQSALRTRVGRHGSARPSGRRSPRARLAPLIMKLLSGHAEMDGYNFMIDGFGGLGGRAGVGGDGVLAAGWGLWGSVGWDRVLVVRDGVGGEFPGVWRLPGGAVAHAEHPERAVVRAVAEQTGLTVAVGRLARWSQT